MVPMEVPMDTEIKHPIMNKPTTAKLEWQQKIYVPSSDSSMNGSHLKVSALGNATWAWEDTVLASDSITTTEGTNDVLYTVTIPKFTVKSIFYGFDYRQIFYEDEEGIVGWFTADEILEKI